MSDFGKVLFIMGVSGTGKSTIGTMVSESLGVPFYDGDDFHPEENIKKMSAGLPLNDNDRQGWLEKLNALAKEQKSKGAVIACSALKERYREILRNEIEGFVHFIYLEGSFELIKSRMELRKGHFMPAELLKSQFETLEPPTDAINVSISHPPEKIVQLILDQTQW